MEIKDCSNENENKLEDNLSLGWIEKYVKHEKDYQLLYKCPVKTISINFIYIDNLNSIIKEEFIEYNLTSSKLTFSDIYNLIKSNNERYKEFKLIYLYKYNFTLDTEEINTFLNDSSQFNFLKKETYFKDIYFYDSILYFKSLNSLGLILKKKNIFLIKIILQKKFL